MDGTSDDIVSFFGDNGGEGRHQTGAQEASDSDAGRGKAHRNLMDEFDRMQGEREAEVDAKELPANSVGMDTGNEKRTSHRHGGGPHGQPSIPRWTER